MTPVLISSSSLAENDIMTDMAKIGLVNKKKDEFCAEVFVHFRFLTEANKA